MQFAVPQFTDVEDKLIGPLTLKQFFVLLGAGGLCLMFWSLPIPKFIAIVIDLPIALAGLALTFAPFNGRPMFVYILPFVSFMISPKSMVFSREALMSNVTLEPPKVKQEIKPPSQVEPADSRLKKLAYLLDSKTQEEKDLIGKAKP